MDRISFVKSAGFNQLFYQLDVLYSFIFKRQVNHIGKRVSDFEQDPQPKKYGHNN